MPRNGAGLYTRPSNTEAVTDQVISSTKFENLIQDIISDLNLDRPIAAGGTGASTAAQARTNLGLGSMAEADADDYLAAANNLSDLADAEDSRTNLGLGSASVKDTGTSGDAIPLLNAANTFSDTLTIAKTANPPANGSTALKLDGDFGGGIAFEDGSKQGTIYVADSGDSLVFDIGTAVGAAAAGKLKLLAGGTATIGGYRILTVNDEGAGNGLDADTVDNIQGSALAQLAGSQTFTGRKAFSAGATFDVTSGVTAEFVTPGNTAYGVVALFKTDGGSDAPGLAFENYNGGSAVRFGITCPSSGGLKFRTNYGESTGFGTEVASLDSSGEFYGADFNVTSDERLKHSIEGLTEGRDVVNALVPVKFHWKRTERADIGFIAQMVQTVIPEAVKTHEDGFLRLTPDKIIPYLVRAVQELSDELDALKGGNS